MSRNDFESSEKTRRAAQQDAARVALQVVLVKNLLVRVFGVNTEGAIED